MEKTFFFFPFKHGLKLPQQEQGASGWSQLWPQLDAHREGNGSGKAAEPTLANDQLRKSWEEIEEEDSQDTKAH